MCFLIIDGSYTASGIDRAYWPTENWEFKTPESQGMDSSTLDEISELIEYNNIIVDGIVIVRNGYVVYRESPSGFALNQRHMIQSCTKSFSSTLIGIALDMGLISSLDSSMLSFFPDRDIANVDERKERITLRHLLTMSPGWDWHEHDFPYTHPNNTLGQMWGAVDPIQYILDRPMSREPGVLHAYNSGTSMLLGAIIEEVSGIDAKTFAAQYLFQPLGIEDIQWIKLKDAYHTDGGLYMKVDDMARFGYLFLNNGTWDGQQIVSSDWVFEASKKHYQVSTSNIGYGFQWWTIDGSSVYQASGHYDQKIYVAPDHDLVVAIIANVADEDPHITDKIMFEFILPSIDKNWESSNESDSIILYVPTYLAIMTIIVVIKKEK